MSPSEFVQWMGQSRVIGEDGRALVVYLGENGPISDDGRTGVHARRGSLTFGSAATASLKASSPDDLRMGERRPQGPRVIPAYLRIENPLVDSPDDPFIDMVRLSEALGPEQARRIALKFADHIENTGLWQEDFAPAHPSVRDFIAAATDEELDGLYFSIHPLLDDPSEVQLLRAAGFDGAIHGGDGSGALEPEYRVFSRAQVLSAIEVGWPASGVHERPEPPAVQLEAPRSTVKKVRSALARIVGEGAVRLSEGLGRLVVTTSREIRSDGYFQVSPSVLASFSADAGFQKMLAEQRAAMVRAIASIGDVGHGAIVRQEDGSTRWQMILRDASEPGKWRTQSFDLKGFSGHMVYPDRDAAIRAAASSGFTVRDDTALDRIQDSPQFQRGLYVTDLIGRVNSRAITHAEGDRLLAQYDECHRVLQSIAASSVQAYVVDGGETMYLLADRIVAGTEEAVFLHEIVHRYGRRILGGDGFAALAQGVKNWSDNPVGTIERVVHDNASSRARAASGTSRTLYDEELIAYAVEEAVSLGVRPRAAAHQESAAGWLDQVASTLRAVIRSSMGGEVDMQSTQDLVDLAYAFAQLESPERFERIMGVLSSGERAELGRLVARGGSPGWFSALEMRVRLHGQSMMPARQWIGWINAQVDSGIKPDEIFWSGVTDWLSTVPPGEVIARQAVVEFLQSNGVRVSEVVKKPPALQPESTETPRSHHLLVDLTAAGYLPDTDSADGSLIGVMRRSDQLLFLFNEETGNFEAETGAEPLPEELAKLAFEYGAALKREGGEQRTAGDARYLRYTLDGAENYRELLLTLPSERTDADFKNGRFLAWMKERYGLDRNAVLNQFEGTQERWRREYLAEGSFKSPHWDEPNVLAHIRLSDRVSAEGGRVLFVEEIQSDWGQQGRIAGFNKRLSGAQKLRLNELRAISEQRDFTMFEQDEFDVLRPGFTQDTVVDGPFVDGTDKWLGLCLKRVIKMAVDEGYDRVAFVTGEQSASRYGLFKQIQAITYRRGQDGKFSLSATKLDEDTFMLTEGVDEKGVAAFVGKDVAEKIVRGEGVSRSGSGGFRVISGLNLRVGGEGMRAFYDQVVPFAVKDLLRKFGGGSLKPMRIGRPSYRYQVGSEDSGQYAVFCEGVVVRRHPTWAKAMEDVDASNRAEDGTCTVQPGFEVGPGLRQVARMGMPLFSFAKPEGVDLSPARDRPDLSDPLVPIESVFPPELADWFGNSCVTVDGLPRQRPLLVFRGASPKDDDVGGIDLVSGKQMGVFWATSSRMNASFYEDGEIQNLYLRLENPMILRASSFSGSPAAAVDHAWRAVQQGVASWDGVIFEDIIDGSHPSVVYAVFPENGSVADRVRIVGRTEYTEEGDPIFSGIQPPCSDPTRFDRGDEIRHDLDWGLYDRNAAARAALEAWRGCPSVVAACSRVSSDVHLSKGVIEVSSLWVDPPDRGNGDASRLMRELVRAADDHGCAIELEVGSDEADIGLVDWYRRLGFAWCNGYMRREAGARVAEPLAQRQVFTDSQQRQRA